MKGPLFSTYRQGENRVTASMLAVFERIDFSLVEELLQAMANEAALQLVRIQNQVVGTTSVPDGSLSANFRYLFETKTSMDSVTVDQLEQHLTLLDGSARDERLFVLTPDFEEPAVLSEIRRHDPRVTWASFSQLSSQIDRLLDSGSPRVSERDAFLLHELQLLFENDGLLREPENVMVVAAGTAYGLYLNHHAYICQNGRGFRRQVTHLAFYTEKTIRPEVPRILYHRDNVLVSEERARALLASDRADDQAFGRLMERLINEDPDWAGGQEQIFILSSPESDDTLRLSQPVRHERPVAWTMGQWRYVSADRLCAAATTADLE